MFTATIPVDTYPVMILLLLTGVIFLVAGFLLYKKPPATINSLYGYRSASAMKSQDRWDFAQKKGGKEMIKAGVILCIAGIVASLIPLTEMVGVIVGLIIVVVTCPIMFLRIEKAIKKKFD